MQAVADALSLLAKFADGRYRKSVDQAGWTLDRREWYNGMMDDCGPSEAQRLNWQRSKDE
jgi:hypothetical protein